MRVECEGEGEYKGGSVSVTERGSARGECECEGEGECKGEGAGG